VRIASKAGSPEHPSWFHNAGANPDVRLGDRSLRAELVEEEASRARLWALADRLFAPSVADRERPARKDRAIPSSHSSLVEEMSAEIPDGRLRVRGIFEALEVRNYRLYFTGQAISLIGTWMQAVAMAWLVLELGHSGTVLGLVVAAQFLPVLLFGPYGGLIVDRVEKRRLLLLTQSVLGILALALGILVVTHLVRLWIVFCFALALGGVSAVDNPARQTFVIEMVGRGRLQNAVSLNSAMVNASRAIGPALAGALIATVGVGVCFLINAASFAAVLVALSMLRVEEIRAAAPIERGRGQLREGLRYVRGTVGLAVPLAMMALIGTLAYEFQVVLPLLAQVTFGSGAQTFGFMTSAMGAGAVVGGLYVAARATTGMLQLTVAALAFGVAILAAALAPTLGVELVALFATGICSTAFLATGNSTLQLTSDSRFRGRVMALWSVTFLGSTPIGGPIIGAIAEQLGPRYSLAAGAAACLGAAAIGAWALRRVPPAQRHALRRAGVELPGAEPTMPR
jgi:MFS family permease